MTENTEKEGLSARLKPTPPPTGIANLPLDGVPSRIRRLMTSASSGVEAGTGRESRSGRVGLPDVLDEEAIASKLRKTAGGERAARSAGIGRNEFSNKVAKSLIVQARGAMERIAGGATDSSLTLQDTVALEAVLHVRGRPALRVEGDRIEDINEQEHPGSNFWTAILQDNEPAIVSATAATGAVHVAVDFGSSFVQGTAWLIKKDLVITNRHVLFPPNGERLARRLDDNPSAARMKSGLTVSIDFAFDNGPPGRKLIARVLDVPFVSQETDLVDVALLRIEPVAAMGAVSPLKISTRNFDLDQLYIIGHPGKLREIPNEVNAVFGSPDERKRVSFGELMDADPSRPGQYIHDASTIGGYSGGCMLAFGFGEREVVGLHYFGDALNGNRAFKSTALLAHQVGQFLV